MADHIIRARNGDREFFKPFPVGQSRYTVLHHAAWRRRPQTVKLHMRGADGDASMQKEVSNHQLRTLKLLIEADRNYQFRSTFSAEVRLLVAL